LKRSKVDRSVPDVRYRRSGSTGEVTAGKHRLRVAWTHAGIAFVDDADVDVADVEKRLKMRLVEKRVPPLIRSSLVEVAKGDGDVDAPIDLSWASEYIQEVLSAAMRIPRGQTRPYSWLAREARRPLAVRAAASAMAKNPLWLLVPCHRVISADGSIGSYGPTGVERKRELLKREGVTLPGRTATKGRPRRR
jgi:O-6-methylguanine DNA methyltransferase